MTNDRYNLYTYIHKGIRFELADLMRTAGNLDFADREAASALVARLRQSLHLMNEHALHEDQFVEPLLQACAPQLARRVAATHQVLESQEEEVLHLCDLAPGNSAAGYKLYLALTRYAATQFGHMAEEEAEIIAALWQRYSDDEIIRAENALVASIEPPKAATYFTWMVPGMNETEREVFLNALRKGAPVEAVAFVEELARAAREAQLAA
ncbi:MAG: hemerythrin domain-containing protein [Planctomycetes bacterium]|nr:hemerythrin domain-containing protein [Planctomycetota bacterium]